MAKVARSKTGKQPKPTKQGGRAARKRETAPLSVPFAITSDGRLVINVTECEGRSLEGREMFTGAVLNEKEARAALGRITNGIADAAAWIAGEMPVQPRASKRGSGKSTRR